VTGLNQIPKNDQPPAKTMLHLSFDTMVGIGTGLFLLAVWFAISWWRRRDLPSTPWFLRIGAIAGVAAVVALECGWIVTEVGRQPWIVNGFMRTADAVTPAKGIWWVFGLTMALYVGLAVTAVVVLRALSRRWQAGAPEGEIPYGPREGERSVASA
jgi:cytochrome d ubiquinol oxidase subunit I